MPTTTPRKRTTNAHKAPPAPTRTNGVAAAVQQYLESRPGEHVWASDIMTATGFTKGQIQQAVSYLRSVGGVLEIGIIRPGNAWRWTPKVQKAAPEETVPVHNIPATPAVGEVKILDVYEGGNLILSIAGKPYHAKPII